MLSISLSIDLTHIKRHNAVIQAIRVSGAHVTSFYKSGSNAYYSIEFDTDLKYTTYIETYRRYNSTIIEKYRKPSLSKRVRSLFRCLCGSVIQSH